eukprot:TRINITY_DN9483_c0_g1_i1.p1 TRINITY_DN9483_c0_g1~~TRINITY_DN9483_c0_g1_i1.p1  ORF type:complete len:334 (-),score=76.25 TRINITY_DN9483_c0_g1_i1:46-1047(-)
MMFSIVGVALLLVAPAALASASPRSGIAEEVFFHQWEVWKTTHHRLYDSKAEHDSRYAVFKDNLDYISEWNAQPHTFTLGLNQFADLTHHQFRKMVLSKPVSMPHNTSEYAASVTRGNGIDYRKLGAVTTVKSQGQCGSCWAFSSVGAAEGAHAVAGNRLVDLSVEQVKDCSSRRGCEGGDTRTAMEYIIDAGLVAQRDYPYRPADTYCHLDDYEVDVVARFGSYVAVRQGDENHLTRVLHEYGPVSVAIDASHRSLQFYRSGIYTEPECDPENLDHGVLLVGYQESADGNYWIVKNSWGVGYGESGYFRLARFHRNHCGIATYAAALVGESH